MLLAALCSLLWRPFHICFQTLVPRTCGVATMALTVCHPSSREPHRVTARFHGACLTKPTCCPVHVAKLGCGAGASRAGIACACSPLPHKCTSEPSLGTHAVVASHSQHPPLPHAHMPLRHCLSMSLCKAVIGMGGIYTRPRDSTSVAGSQQEERRRREVKE